MSRQGSSFPYRNSKQNIIPGSANFEFFEKTKNLRAVFLNNCSMPLPSSVI